MFSYSLTWLVRAGCRNHSFSSSVSSVVFALPRLFTPISDFFAGGMLPVMESSAVKLPPSFPPNKRRERRRLSSINGGTRVFGVFRTSGSSTSGDCWNNIKNEHFLYWNKIGWFLKISTLNPVYPMHWKLEIHSGKIGKLLLKIKGHWLQI